MTNPNLVKIFKAYDIRGVYPEEINEETAYQIGLAAAAELKTEKILVGRDARKMSPALQTAVINGLRDAGADVRDIGLITTDMLYFASGHFGLPGLTITASHNPAEYCGMKIVRAGAVPMSRDGGLAAIRDRIAQDGQSAANSSRRGAPPTRRAELEEKDILPDYLEHVLSFIDRSKIKPFKIVANANFGPASIVVKKLAGVLPLQIVPLDFEINGAFPKGRPDPLIPERRSETAELIKKSGVDLGVAWDGDADRCFFWDGAGNFIHPYYVGILLAKYLMDKNRPGPHKIIRCARDGKLFDKAIRETGGVPLESRVGHVFIKEKMRAEQALFGAEISGHYYFRNNYFADNGIIPFLLVLEILGQSGKTLGELAREYQEQMDVSDEINFTVADAGVVMKKIETAYGGTGQVDHLDGLTVDAPEWRVNLRPSNTEPFLRLNVEASNQVVLLKIIDKVKKIISAE